MSEETKVLEAINTIENYMEQEGVFLATSMWRAKDGTILSCDWGYFDDGMKEIKKYIDKKYIEKRKPKGFVADEWYRENFGENNGK